MPRSMHETKKYARQDDAVFVKINKKPPKYVYVYVYLYMHVYMWLN